MYKQSIKNVRKELDIVNIMKTLYKLKASMSILIAKFPESLEKIKVKYHENCTLLVDESKKVIPVVNLNMDKKF